MAVAESMTDADGKITVEIQGGKRKGSRLRIDPGGTWSPMGESFWITSYGERVCVSRCKR